MTQPLGFVSLFLMGLVELFSQLDAQSLFATDSQSAGNESIAGATITGAQDQRSRQRGIFNGTPNEDLPLSAAAEFSA